MNGAHACVDLKVAEPRSIAFHLLHGIDLVGGLCNLAISENTTHDRPRLGGLLGVAVVNGGRREPVLGSVRNAPEPRPTNARLAECTAGLNRTPDTGYHVTVK